MNANSPSPLDPDNAHAIAMSAMDDSIPLPLDERNGVEVRHLSKCFSISTAPMGRMSALFLNRLISGVRKQDFWALKDVSLTIKKGEMLGILGVNGSGKSTLLRLITGISQPTSGEIRRLPRIAPLLDLSAGLHPALSGYENLFLNAAIIGIPRDELRALLPDIIAFSGLDHKFLEAPVRTYSAGMMARLGFSLAVSVDPDIILVDEVLAVGDMEFQAKSAQRLLEFRDQGKAMALVSHTSAAIGELSTEAVWLHDGVIKASGKAGEVVSVYNSHLTEKVRRQGRKEGLEETQSVIRKQPRAVHFDGPRLLDSAGKPAEVFETRGHLSVSFILQATEPTPPVDVTFVIQYQTGIIVEEFYTSERGFTPVVLGEKDRCRVTVTLDPLMLLPGEYVIELTAFDAADPDSVLGISEAADFTVESECSSFNFYPAYLEVEFKTD